MSITIPRTAVILVLLGGVWWLARDGEGAGDGEDGASASAPAAAATEAMRSRLELAVTSAANAAECGFTEVGYDRRTPEEGARRLVALMKSASAGPAGEEPRPGTDVDYVEDRPGAPWQVAVRPSAEGDALLIEGYGTDLSEPLAERRVECR